MDHEAREMLPLSKAAEYLIGFFSPGFEQKLGLAEPRLHLLALALVAIAVALVMTPAAYHRQTGRREITETFVTIRLARTRRSRRSARA